MDSKQNPQLQYAQTVVPGGMPMVQQVQVTPVQKKDVAGLIKTIVIIIVSCAVHTFALMRSSNNVGGSVDAATWSVTRNYSQSGDSIDIYKGGITDSYTLTVQSNSEVDVLYRIVIDNLPSGVVVDIDNTGFQTPSAGGTLIIENANTVINYNDVSKTKTHILTFKANNDAVLVYNAQLFVNLTWTFLFFTFRWFLFSFIWLLLLILLVILMIIKFYKISKTSAYLQIPYLLWIIFAAVLNFSIYTLN